MSAYTNFRDFEALNSVALRIGALNCVAEKHARAPFLKAT